MQKFDVEHYSYLLAELVNRAKGVRWGKGFGGAEGGGEDSGLIVDGVLLIFSRGCCLVITRVAGIRRTGLRRSKT